MVEIPIRLRRRVDRAETAKTVVRLTELTMMLAFGSLKVTG